MKVLVAQLCLTLCDPMDDIACQAPLSLGFSRQRYWSRLPCLSPGDLPDPVIKPGSPTSQADSSPSGKGNPSKISLLVPLDPQLSTVAPNLIY